jgi:hypothetical protein
MLIFVTLIVISIRDLNAAERVLAARGDDAHLAAVVTSLKLGLLGVALGIFFLSEQFNPILYQCMAMAMSIKPFLSQRTGEMKKEMPARGNRGWREVREREWTPSS